MKKRAWSCAPSLLLLLSLALSGCATKAKPYHDDPKNSYALNIMRARGAQDIRDSKPDSAGGQGPSVIGMAAAGWAGAGSSGPASLGLSSLAGAGLNVLAFAIPEKTLESSSLCFAWVKKGNESKDEVFSRFEGQVAQAFRRAIEETPLPSGYSYELVHEHLAHVKIAGPECGDDTKCGYNVYAFKTLKDGFAPDTLGGGEAWRLDLGITTASHKPNSVFDPGKALFNDLLFYQNLSAGLPPETFIYLAPQQGTYRISMQTEQGMRFLQVPVLLNKGEIHRFIAPGQ